jgi:hypothetical protein
MTTKYGFSDVRDQLIKDLKGAYPTRWEDFQTAKILGEDIFGSPKPHPNAVLNLFEAQDVRFAIPFAAYRASIGGLSALMSDEPGAVLPRHTLATTIHGMHVMRNFASSAWHSIAYAGDLRKCPDKICVLSTGTGSIDEWLGVLGKIYDSMVDERKSNGNVLSPPPLGHLFCAKCAKRVEEVHATLRSILWKKLAPAFAASNSWDSS